MQTVAKSRLPLIAYGLAALVVVLDQISKFWILGRLTPGESLAVLPFMNFTLTHNTGVSYGLFNNFGQAGRWLLSLFSLIVAVTLAVWVRKADKRLSALGVGLIIGGALGNLVDRVRLGWVVDFVDCSALHFPWIFNIADSAISIGVVLFLVELVVTPDKKPEAKGSGEATL
ncbi:MAG: signal peptidase II [Caulobacteraceae bacterium]|nr:MAG: signal peptidase II [Caulobacteraceae bacterium]